jgi:hypothetical protein
MRLNPTNLTARSGPLFWLDQNLLPITLILGSKIVSRLNPDGAMAAAALDIDFVGKVLGADYALQQTARHSMSWSARREHPG